MLFGWVGLAEFARKQGVHPVTLRRWALALHHEHGDLLRWNQRKGRPRKYWCHPQRLEAALRADPEAKEATRELTESRLDSHDNKLEALKKAVKSLKVQMNQLSLDFNQRTSANNVGHESPHSL